MPLLESLRPQTVRRGAVTDEAVAALVSLILDRGLRPGDKLPSERELMAQLSVGRSSLREAIRTLSALGMVEVAVGSGMYVADGGTSALTRPLSWGLLMGGQSTRDVIDARRVVEVELAGLAAERATEEDLEAIADQLNLLRANADDAERCARFDVEFHLAIGRAAHSEVLYHVLETLRHLLRVWFAEVYPRHETPSVPGERHAELLEVIRSRDAEAARRTMAKHHDEGAAWLLERIAGASANGRRNAEQAAASPGRTGH